MDVRGSQNGRDGFRVARWPAVLCVHAQQMRAECRRSLEKLISLERIDPQFGQQAMVCPLPRV